MPSDSELAVRAALGRYDDALLRAIASKLFKPRSQWPAEELIDRAVEALANPPVIDRRIKDLSPSCRALLAAIGLIRHRDWSVGQLLALLAILGHSEGLMPVLSLLDSGLAMPILPETDRPIRRWEDWLGATPTAARLHVPATVAERAIREGTGLPQLASKRFDARHVHTSDGLEWLLRLGVLWQRLRADPIRLTQANALFKRDLQRLQEDPLLGSSPTDLAVDVPDPGVLAMSLGIASGVFVATDGVLSAGTFPPSWDTGLSPTVADLWSALPAVTHWDAEHGYFLSESGEPFAVIALASLLLLAAQPDGVWTHPSDVAEYLYPRHPSWASTLVDPSDQGESWIEAMFLGWALPMRLVEATQDGEGWWVRLTTIGRHLVASGPAPELGPEFSRCLVVQPNGDVIAYRQGLTPGLIARLSRFADWKMIGPACTLGLSAESVYRGLESGMSLPDILGVLQQHSGHPVPANVQDLVRRWAGKRERITVHTSATLLEFASPSDLESAMTRGLVVQKLTDRIGLANGEVDYKHFRLLGNRDYEAKPQRCITFAPDGVTFRVDVAASDLLLEAELSRLAEPLTNDGEHRFRITPETARRIREQGMALADLETWSASRAGEPLSASARLLFSGSDGAAGELRQRIVVTLPSEIVTDGVCKWPETADLLDDRLGPKSVTVPEENVEELLKRLAELGVEVRRE